MSSCQLAFISSSTLLLFPLCLSLSMIVLPRSSHERPCLIHPSLAKCCRLLVKAHMLSEWVIWRESCIPNMPGSIPLIRFTLAEAEAPPCQPWTEWQGRHLLQGRHSVWLGSLHSSTPAPLEDCSQHHPRLKSTLGEVVALTQQDTWHGHLS